MNTSTNDRMVWMVLATIAAVGFAIWAIKRDNGDGDLIDELGDALNMLTTSEQTRLNNLEPETRGKVSDLITSLQGDGLTVYVGQTLRTPAQEKAAIDSGHSAVKTHSWHELGRAADLYPVNPDTGKADLNGTRLDLFWQMQQRAMELGFRQIAFNDDGSKRYITNSAGKKIWDGGHVEYRGPYATIAEAVAAEGEAYGIA